MRCPPRPALSVFALFCSVSIAVGWPLQQSSPPTSTPSFLTGLALATRVDKVDTLAREPMIVEHPTGTLFVAGYAGSGGNVFAVPQLWTSTDHGANWMKVNVGTEAQGAIGNSDVDLGVAKDGTLYFITMGFSKAREGTHIAVGVSKDVGATWAWTMLSKKRFDDRPWIAVTPDGTAHAIWNDGEGVYHTVSRDRGTTWSTPLSVHPVGGSSHLAVGPNGEVAIRIVPLSASGRKFTPGVDLIAVSTDVGATWQKHPAPGQRDWAPMRTEGTIPRWVEPVAWDSGGTLYSLWTNARGVWLGQSLDRGSTWNSRLVVPGNEISYFPYLVARHKGELAATWFTGAGESLRFHVAKLQIEGRNSAPRVVEATPLQADSWRAGNSPRDAPVRDAAGEYVPILFLSDGNLAVVSAIQDPALNLSTGECPRCGFSFWTFRKR